MSEATSPAVATPAPAGPQGGQQPGSQQQGANVTPIRQHHSATQPREVGRFAGPPQGGETQATPAPRVLKVGDREIPEGEALVLLQERMEDRRLSDEERREFQRLRQEAQRWKDPRQALTPQQQEEIAREQLRRFMEMEEEKKLPPEVQAFRQQQREFARQKAEFDRQQEELRQQHLQAQEVALREEATSNVRATMQALGAPETDGVTLMLVAAEWEKSARAGRRDTAAVIAHRVQRSLDVMASGRVVAGGPKALLGNPKVVEMLNGLKADEHADLLKALGPFLETARAFNLQQRGLAAVPAPAPQGGQQPALQPGQQPRTTQEWVAYFKGGGARNTPELNERYWKLKDQGAL